MSDDAIQILAVAALALTELYAVRGVSFAWLWDFIARVTGAIANFFGRIAVQSRLNYFESVEA